MLFLSVSSLLIILLGVPAALGTATTDTAASSPHPGASSTVSTTLYRSIGPNTDLRPYRSLDESQFLYAKVELMDCTFRGSRDWYELDLPRIDIWNPKHLSSFGPAEKASFVPQLLQELHKSFAGLSMKSLKEISVYASPLHNSYFFVLPSGDIMGFFDHTNRHAPSLGRRVEVVLRGGKLSYAFQAIGPAGARAPTASTSPTPSRSAASTDNTTPSTQSQDTLRSRRINQDTPSMLARAAAMKADLEARRARQHAKVNKVNAARSLVQPEAVPVITSSPACPDTQAPAVPFDEPCLSERPSAQDIAAPGDQGAVKTLDNSEEEVAIVSLESLAASSEDNNVEEEEEQEQVEVQSLAVSSEDNNVEEEEEQEQVEVQSLAASSEDNNVEEEEEQEQVEVQLEQEQEQEESADFSVETAALVAELQEGEAPHGSSLASAMTLTFAVITVVLLLGIGLVLHHRKQRAGSDIIARITAAGESVRGGLSSPLPTSRGAFRSFRALDLASGFQVETSLA